MASTTFSGPVTSTNGFVGDVTGNVTGTLVGNQSIPTTTKAAAGANQGAATEVALGFNLVTGADDAKGVKLPTAVAGQIVIIKNNTSAKTIKVYPGTSDKINGGSANAALDMAGLTAAMFIAYDATDWYSLPLLPS